MIPFPLRWYHHLFTDDTITMVLVSLNVDLWYPSLDLPMIPPLKLSHATTMKLDAS
jgi:hypothetical protein